MNDLSRYFSDIGRKGGASGKGSSKRRPPEHYRRMVEIRNRKRAEKNNGQDPPGPHPLPK